MEYPKAVMKKTELEKMGFPEEFLFRAYRVRGQTFAQKLNPAKRNSPILFETAGFEKWRMNQLEMENKSMYRR